MSPRTIKKSASAKDDARNKHNENVITNENTKGSVVNLTPRSDLFINDTIKSIEDRSLTYLQAGIPVHLSGPAGTGKSTLAFQIAARLNRPSIIMTGDAWMKASDLVGSEGGTRSRQVVDRYIQSVRKVESETSSIWNDGFLTMAMTHGYTLVYDEFSRSPPEANNALLMALEERTLAISHPDKETKYVNAHPEFRAIFTSNPEEYVGVQGVQDALVDRMITLNLDGHDLKTEAGIVSSSSGIGFELAETVVSLTRIIREQCDLPHLPSVRSGIMIGKILANSDLDVSASNPAFIQLCMDVFLSKTTANAVTADYRSEFIKKLHQAIVSATSKTAMAKMEEVA